jgi:L-fucose mutarotase/ribose pyranase (RbsD/FucU family)
MFHGEEFRNNFDAQVNVVHDNPYMDLIFDVAGTKMGSAMGPGDVTTIVDEESPNDAASRFYDLLRDADEPLWNGCESHTILSAVLQLMKLKSEYNLS